MAYPSNFIGPLPQGASRDVSFDEGEFDAFYGTKPQPNESVRFNPQKNSYEQQSALGAGDNKNGSFDASAFAKSLGYNSSSAAKSALGVSSLEDYYKSNKTSLGDSLRRQTESANKIGSSWEPIFSELDRQLGSIPQKQSEYEGKIGESAKGQLEGVERSRERSTESLESEKARGLRDLESDIRNQLEAAGRKIGVAGAGSSSAVGQASEAVARVGQKARGGFLETVTQKLTDINNLATEQRAKIDQWKGDKLFEIQSFFQDKMDQLSSQLASAKKDRKQAVESLIMDAEKQYINALRSLDGEVMGYSQSIDMWERQRAAELEDYAMRQSDNAKNTPADLQTSLGLFNELLANGYDARQAEEYLNARGIALPEGLNGRSPQAAPEYDIYQDENGNSFYYDQNNPQAGFIPMPGLEGNGSGAVPDWVPGLGRF